MKYDYYQSQQPFSIIVTHKINNTIFKLKLLKIQILKRRLSLIVKIIYDNNPTWPPLAI